MFNTTQFNTDAFNRRYTTIRAAALIGRLTKLKARTIAVNLAIRTQTVNLTSKDASTILRTES